MAQKPKLKVRIKELNRPLTEKEVMESAPKVDDRKEDVILGSGKVVKGEDVPKEQLKLESGEEVEGFLDKVGGMEVIAAMLFPGGKGGKRPQRQMKPMRKSRFARRKEMKRKERGKGKAFRGIRAKAAFEKAKREAKDAQVQAFAQARDLKSKLRLKDIDNPTKKNEYLQSQKVLKDTTDRLKELNETQNVFDSPKEASAHMKRVAKEAQDFTKKFEASTNDPSKARTRFHQEMIKSEIENMETMLEAFSDLVDNPMLPMVDRVIYARRESEMFDLIEGARKALQPKEFEPMMRMGVEKEDMN